MRDKKYEEQYEVIKIFKRNGRTVLLIDFKQDIITEDMIKNLRLELKAGVYGDYQNKDEEI